MLFHSKEHHFHDFVVCTLKKFPVALLQPPCFQRRQQTFCEFSHAYVNNVLCPAAPHKMIWGQCNCVSCYVMWSTFVRCAFACQPPHPLMWHIAVARHYLDRRHRINEKKSWKRCVLSKRIYKEVYFLQGTNDPAVVIVKMSGRRERRQWHQVHLAHGDRICWQMYKIGCRTLWANHQDQSGTWILPLDHDNFLSAISEDAINCIESTCVQSWYRRLNL